MERSLVWNGVLKTVRIPIEVAPLSERAIWTYVQMRAVGQEHGPAMCAALQLDFPGLSWSTGQVRPFGSVVSGHDAAVSSAEFDKSSPNARDHSHSQKPRPPSSSQAGNGGVSGTAGHRKHLPQSTTSIASSHRDRSGGAVGPRPSSQRPTPAAKPHTGGWMGSVATNA